MDLLSVIWTAVAIAASAAIAILIEERILRRRDHTRHNR